MLTRPGRRDTRAINHPHIQMYGGVDEREFEFAVVKLSILKITRQNVTGARTNEGGLEKREAVSAVILLSTLISNFPCTRFLLQAQRCAPELLIND